MLQLKNLSVLLLGELATRIVTVAAFLHLARVLKPALFGLVELTLSVMMFATLLIDQGFAILGAREIAREPRRTARLVRRIVSVQLLLAMATVATFAVLLLWLPLDPRLRGLLLAYSISLLGYPFLLSWVLQAQRRMGWFAAGQLLRQAVFAALVLMLVRDPAHLPRLPLAEIAGVSAAAALFLYAYLGNGGRLSLRLFSPANWRILRQSAPIGGSNLVWVARMFLPVFVVGMLLDPAQTGFFGAAHRVMMLVQTLMAAYFTNLFPSLSQAAGVSPLRMLDLLHGSLPLLTWPAALGALLTIWLAPLVIRLLYGAEFVSAEAVASLQILVWLIPVLAIRRHLVSALLALNHQNDEFRCSLAGVLLLAPMLVLLSLRYGVAGAALAMLISELLATALTWMVLKAHAPQTHVLRSLMGRSRGDALAPSAN